MGGEAGLLAAFTLLSCHLFSLLFDVSILHLALEVYTEFGTVSSYLSILLAFFLYYAHRIPVLPFLADDLK